MPGEHCWVFLRASIEWRIQNKIRNCPSKPHSNLLSWNLTDGIYSATPHYLISWCHPRTSLGLQEIIPREQEEGEGWWLPCAAALSNHPQITVCSGPTWQTVDDVYILHRYHKYHCVVMHSGLRFMYAEHKTSLLWLVECSASIFTGGSSENFPTLTHTRTQACHRTITSSI